MNVKWSTSLVLLVLIVSVVACTESTHREHVASADDTYHFRTPAGFPEPVFPQDNLLTKARVELGRKLFYDPIVSRDSTIACASCHLQELAFADTGRFSRGVGDSIGFRNAPALFNHAWQTVFMRDGGTPTLELQVLAPINDHLELDFNILAIVERLKRDSDYVQQSRLAYDREPDPFVVTRALAAFERTLISGDSRYDDHVNGTPTLTDEEIAGMELFSSERTQCSSCHSGFNFTNEEYRNNGLYETFVDTGRARITFLREDVGKFRVPSLRNVALTAPYMHDGSVATLQEVLQHYLQGGQGHYNQDTLIRPFELTELEQTQLIAFLSTLTDRRLLSNPEYTKP